MAKHLILVNMKYAIKLPRKLKKGLKKALKLQYPNWETKEMQIGGIRRKRVPHRISYKGWFVCADRFGF